MLNTDGGPSDDAAATTDGGANCAGATLGVKGTWGQGDVFGGWLSSRSNNGATDSSDLGLQRRC